MIHILLTILKIIGIIILAILGLLLLLVLVVLCVPVRYRLDAEMPGEIKKSTGNGRITWLLHLIRIDVTYAEQKLKWKVRIAWKTMKSEEEVPEKIREEKEESHEKRQEQNQEQNRKDDQKRNEEKKEGKTETDTRAEKAPEKEKRSLESSETSEKRLEEKPEKHPEENSQSTETVQEEDEKQSRFEKIKCTITKFCDKIEHTAGRAKKKLTELSEKKDRIINELEDPVHQKAVSKVLKELKKLLRRWKPKVLSGKIRFGFEDPYHTGQALAVLSVLYPFLGGHFEAEPDFEQRILEGNIKIRGGICVMPLVCLAWNLIWCKEIRSTWHDIRNFKF